MNSSFAYYSKQIFKIQLLKLKIWARQANNREKKQMGFLHFKLEKISEWDGNGMEDQSSVSSPTMVLRFPKSRISAVSFNDKHAGPKTSEVHGFVGSITTIVTAVNFMVWAYLPEAWLHSALALGIPAYAMVDVVVALLFYIGLNFLSTAPGNS